MLIYPDSSDLINLCRNRGRVSVSELAQKLRAGSHRIVLSMQTLMEVAAPLRNGLLLEVRRDLNELEKLPLIFVNEGRLVTLEIEEAVRGFEQHREYDAAAVCPFANRLADAIDLFGHRLYVVECGMRVPVEMIVNYGITETILYLWKSEPLAFDVQRRREQEWIRLVESDRSMVVTPRLADHFVTALERTLRTHGIHPPEGAAEKFGRWVYDSPSRCPGIRLAYETQHRFRRDRQARASASDIIDLVRINAAPYVDFFITDSAMMMYSRQAATEIGVCYPQLFGDLDAVISRLC